MLQARYIHTAQQTIYVGRNYLSRKSYLIVTEAATKKVEGLSTLSQTCRHFLSCPRLTAVSRQLRIQTSPGNVLSSVVICEFRSTGTVYELLNNSTSKEVIFTCSSQSTKSEDHSLNHSQSAQSKLYMQPQNFHNRGSCGVSSPCTWAKQTYCSLLTLRPKCALTSAVALSILAGGIENGCRANVFKGTSPGNSAQPLSPRSWISTLARQDHTYPT